MEILFLIILKNHVFSGIHEMPVNQEVVSSPEQAAILLWERQQSVSFPEPENYTGHLYEIDLVKMIVKKVDIPKLFFQQD